MHLRGTCHALFAYDVGFAIDLDAAEAKLTELRRRGKIKHRRRAPDPGDHPPPLRVTQSAPTIQVGPVTTEPTVETVLYEFGAMAVSYSFRIDVPIERLAEYSWHLYDHEPLLADSRSRVEQLVAALTETVARPAVSEVVEDYVIFEIDPESLPVPLAELTARHAQDLARALRAEIGVLSEGEVKDALSHGLSYGLEDLTLVDWFAAIIIGREPDDERSVLEVGTVELLELRHLDFQLDAALDDAYDLLSNPRSAWFPVRGEELNRIAHLQADNAILFEGVDNALKLTGDHYLARIYRLVSERFHLSEWDGSIQRKLEVLEGIYEKLVNRAAGRRMEILEWIIIVLIAISILVMFLPGGSH